MSRRGELKCVRSEFVGKMQFYLAALDDLAGKGRKSIHRDILCKDKDRRSLNTLCESKKPIGVANIVVLRVPADLKVLPAPAQIKLLLEDV